jgi:hypothetical protein
MPDVLYSHLTIVQEKGRAIWRISHEAFATRNVRLYPQLAVSLSRANYVRSMYNIYRNFPNKIHKKYFTSIIHYTDYPATSNKI